MNILIENKLNIFHYKIARVLDKWREMGDGIISSRLSWSRSAKCNNF